MVFRDLKESEKLYYSSIILRQRKYVRALYPEVADKDKTDAVNSIILKRVTNSSLVNPTISGASIEFINEALLYAATNGDKVPTADEMYDVDENAIIVKRGKYLDGLKASYKSAEKEKDEKEKARDKTQIELKEAVEKETSATAKSIGHTTFELIVRGSVIGLGIAALACLSKIMAFVLAATFPTIATIALAGYIGYKFGKPYVYEPIKGLFNKRKTKLQKDKEEASKAVKTKQTELATKNGEFEEAKDKYNDSKTKYLGEKAAVASLTLADGPIEREYNRAVSKLGLIADKYRNIINESTMSDDVKKSSLNKINEVLSRYELELMHKVRVNSKVEESWFSASDSITDWKDTSGSICARAERVMGAIASVSTGISSTDPDYKKIITQEREKYLASEELSV